MCMTGAVRTCESFIKNRLCVRARTHRRVRTCTHAEKKYTVRKQKSVKRKMHIMQAAAQQYNGEQDHFFVCKIKTAH